MYVYVCIALPSLSSERGARCDNLPLGMLIGFCKRLIARVQQLSLRPQPAPRPAPGAPRRLVRGGETLSVSRQVGTGVYFLYRVN